MHKFKLILVTLLFPSMMFAQSAKSYSYEDPTLLTDTVKLTEVIVQSSKTDDNLQDIQAATSLISKLQIEEQNLSDLTELTGRISNFYMPDYGTRLTAPIYIRGIGSRLNNPSVGLYVDGVPYFDKGTFNFDFFNLEKIEVLRGPQGTLYGRNTMGGIINVYTPEPEFNSTGTLKVEYGVNNYYKAIVETNQKLSKSLALIIGGAHSHSDGFFTNTYANTQADKYNIYNGHFKLLYKPSENFQSQLTVNFEKLNQNGYPYALYNTDTQTIADINYNRESTYERSLLSMGLISKYTTDKFILTSASSFQHMEDYQGVDQDFTASDLFWVDQDRTQNTVVEELSIRSLSSSKINWIAGLFAFHQGADKEVGVTYGSDAVSRYHLPGPMNYSKIYDQPVGGIAAYGQITYPFGKFKATLGVRADYESTQLDYNYEKWLNGNSIATDAFESKLSFTQYMPKASLSFNPTENITLFTSVSQGYKAGGFNSTFENDEDRTFEPEYSTNYEFGLKSVFLKNRLITNLNVFYIDWRDQQVYQPVPSGTGSMLANAGRSESKGVELELHYLINRNVSIWGSYGYNEAKYIDYVRDETRDYSNNLIPYVPKSTLNLGANYTVNINKGIRSATLTANYQHIGDLYWNDANTAFQKSYGLLNARLNFHSRIFDFGLWGKNLLDTTYNAFYFEALGNSYAQAGKPIQYGVFMNINI